MIKLTKKYIKSQLYKREVFSEKSEYGHALIIAGKKGYMGAAVIATKAAIRSGVGLVTVCVPANERVIIQTCIPEAMLLIREGNEYNFDKFSAIGIGPGLGTDKVSQELLLSVITHYKKPLLLDADGLNIISNNKNILSEIPSETIITPHCREFDRLFGIHKNNDDRIKTAIIKAKKYNLIIVLKSHCTAIVSPEQLFYNTTGNSGLAKGGSGDALSGIITSFLAQGYSPITAANLGVFIHGFAADITIKCESMESMLISDVINNFGKAFKKIRK
ncbi:NAD(P)H-hydrate dehydratase [Flavobacterium sp.]|uniref:NAD(P)H-hydrate dehydratase n=1 Tax=Flavobacterium sp. TaxID=239 RepID=UPI00286BA93F|nr:NAD(P)H-hydrate dehydratase [Flavobacterium sp.]